jgi:hypothetical protein
LRLPVGYSARRKCSGGLDGAAVALLACEALPELLDCVQSGEEPLQVIRIIHAARNIPQVLR